MGGGEDARRRCHCQKTLTPPDEASVDASTHSTAQHTRTHHGQAHTRNTHRDLARTRAGSRATNRAPSTLHTRAAVQPCTLNIGGVAHATHASMRGSAGRGSVGRSFMFANGVREPFVFACVCVRLQIGSRPHVRIRSRTFTNVREPRSREPTLPRISQEWPRHPPTSDRASDQCCSVLATAASHQQ